MVPIITHGPAALKPTHHIFSISVDFYSLYEAFLNLLDKPTPPLGPAEVMESSAFCIEFKWRPPKDDGGSPVINYMLERKQVGRNTWKKIKENPGAPKYRDTDVDRGRKYCYRIRAVTSEGTSEAMETDEMQAGKFGKKNEELHNNHLCPHGIS